MKDTEGMEDLIGEIQKGLINWYDFRLNSRILYIGKEDDAYFHLLQNLPLEMKSGKKNMRMDLTISLPSGY